VDTSALRTVQRGRTVLLGTFAWDIESDRQLQVDMRVADVRWEQVHPGESYLTPIGQSRLAKVVASTPDSEDLKLDDIAALAYSLDPVPNSFLTGGALLGLRTNEGNLAKLKVVGYRDSHDFSFEPAKSLPAPTRASMSARPNRPNYHLEIGWVLWRK
jgi:hypothetical protein